jgi:hypothetical protein
MGKKKPDIEREIDRLYQEPLESFVKERDALAKRLRAEDDRESADRVKAQAKPGLAAWTVNQLHWEAKKELARWIDASRVLGTLQPRAAGWPMAIERRKAALDRLMERSQSLLTAAGHAASRSTLRRIETALDSLAVRGDKTVAIHPGRLTEDLEPAGLDALRLMALAPPPPPEELLQAKTSKQRAHGDKRQSAARQTTGSALKAQLAQRALEHAERELVRRQEALEKAQLITEEAIAEAADARRELRRSQAHAHRIEAALHKARAANRRAGYAVDRAKQELTKARRKRR